MAANWLSLLAKSSQLLRSNWHLLLIKSLFCVRMSRLVLHEKENVRYIIPAMINWLECKFLCTIVSLMRTWTRDLTLPRDAQNRSLLLSREKKKNYKDRKKTEVLFPSIVMLIPILIRDRDRFAIRCRLDPDEETTLSHWEIPRVLSLRALASLTNFIITAYVMREQRVAAVRAA